VPFPNAAENDADLTPIAGYVARLNSLAAVLISFQTTAGVNNCTLVPILWNRTLSEATDITNGVGKKLWATQRRRGDFGRINTFPV
jgi:hypothetical protein